METVIEEDPDELRDVDEFFSWDEDADEEELCDEFEEEQQNELSDYASDIRHDLNQLLSHVQTREPR